MRLASINLKDNQNGDDDGDLDDDHDDGADSNANANAMQLQMEKSHLGTESISSRTESILSLLSSTLTCVVLKCQLFHR